MSAQSEIGDEDDVISLKLNGETITTYEDYVVESSVLTQPATFRMSLGGGVSLDNSGDGTPLSTLIGKYPPNTPFQLYVGKTLVQTGKTDGYEVSDGEGASKMVIDGRDALAPLHDAFVLASKSFSNITYKQLVVEAFKAVGIDPGTLVADNNDANRKAISAGQADATTTKPAAGPKPINHPVYVKIGERWYEFLRRILDRAGLFLWAAADGTFVLTEPNAKQTATYKIMRKRGQTRDEVNVKRASLRNSTQPRFSNCVIYARGGGKKYGAAQDKGAFIDDQMYNGPPGYGFGTSKPLVLRDVDAADKQAAEYHARRKLAEGARAGWHLTYTLAGHTAPSLAGGLAVWAPDTLVDVDDDEYGLKGTYWIESVTFQRQPQTTTTIVLMDKTHLVFGSDEY